MCILKQLTDQALNWDIFSMLHNLRNVKWIQHMSKARDLKILEYFQ